MFGELVALVVVVIGCAVVVGAREVEERWAAGPAAAQPARRAMPRTSR